MSESNKHDDSDFKELLYQKLQEFKPTKDKTDTTTKLDKDQLDAFCKLYNLYLKSKKEKNNEDGLIVVIIKAIAVLIIVALICSAFSFKSTKFHLFIN